MDSNNWAVIVPMANESKDFDIFIKELTQQLDSISSGSVYLVVDKASMDNTFTLCQELSLRDSRFKTIWAPENKNVVDAYIRGYKEAFNNGHDLFIEMDAGMAHDPKSLPVFLKYLNEGMECVFGSRFMKGGYMNRSPYSRYFLSKGGTIISNLLLGTKLTDMTSGFQGFQRHIVEKFLNYTLLSKGHFYQTELRYLLRNCRFLEVPIHYYALSKSIHISDMANSIIVLVEYWIKKIRRKGELL